MNMKRTLNDFQKKAIDEDTQVLLESGMVGDDLLLTTQGQAALLNFLLMKNKKAVAQTLREEWAEFEAMSQEDKAKVLSTLN